MKESRHGKAACATPSAASSSAAGGAAKRAKARARDLGIPLPGAPGPLNAITDVAGVEVGHVTLIEGEGPLVIGKGPCGLGSPPSSRAGRGRRMPSWLAAPCSTAMASPTRTLDCEFA